MGVLYILLALFIFGLLIFIHELGHFLVARACGVAILEFAIGMGPKVLSKKSKKSGIVYSLRLFPIGGFVSMLGENGMEAVQGSNQPEVNDDIPMLIEDAIKVKKEENAAEEVSPVVFDEKNAYCNQSVGKRILISLAGPFMNLLLGFILMLVMVIISGSGAVGTTEVAGFFVTYQNEQSEYGFLSGDYIDAVNDTRIFSMEEIQKILSEGGEDALYTVTVQRLNEDGSEILNVTLENVPLSEELLKTHFVSSLSAQSGLKVGDEVIKVNGTSVHTYNELAYEVMNQGYKPVTLTVKRTTADENGKESTENVVLENVQVPNMVDEASGVTFGELDFRVWREESFGVGTVLKHTWYRSLSTVKMVYDSLAGLFSGRYGVEAVSGPVGITKTISDAAQTGFLNVLYLVIVISINLGIMNLLPIPAMDGGHILLYLIEAVRRKPLKPEIEGIINFVGLILVLALAVLVSIKDVISL